jgi:hypothetical protein
MLGRGASGLGWVVLSLWLAAPVAWWDEVAAGSAAENTGHEKPRAAPRVCHGRMLTGISGPCIRGSWREWLVRGDEYPDRISV